MANRDNNFKNTFSSVIKKISEKISQVDVESDFVISNAEGIDKDSKAALLSGQNWGDEVLREYISLSSKSSNSGSGNKARVNRVQQTYIIDNNPRKIENKNKNIKYITTDRGYRDRV